jgi:hypothetical protein
MFKFEIDKAKNIIRCGEFRLKAVAMEKERRLAN